MLQRVSAALIKFISPIASSMESTPFNSQNEKKSRQEAPQKEVPRLEPNPKENNQPKPHLSLVPNQTDPKELPPAPPLLAQPFVQLLALFQEQRSSTIRREGIQTYLKNLIRHKRIGKSQKGIVLDQRSE